jgi:hypothetical protein
MYQRTRNQVPMPDARIIHQLPIDQILNWTKSHLNAYLATAEVILEQNIDPG